MDWLSGALQSGLDSLADYLSAHVITCLIPALFIAGAIGVFIKREQILKYMGPDANRVYSYGFASVSGALLAVCSCTILPLFAGIRKKGAGIGPAITFLFSGPAINVLAIVYTASALGFALGVARAASAIVLSIIIGLTMSFLFKEKKDEDAAMFAASEDAYKKHHVPVFFILLVAVLLIATAGIDMLPKAALLIILIAAVQYAILKWFKKDEVKAWFVETWKFTKMIFPVILAGVFVIGIVSYFMPPEFLGGLVQGNTLMSCFIAAVIGVILYMPTLLEVPIVGTIFGYNAGIMGPGPALALLLAGPGVSLPNLLVTRRVLGTQKTLVFACLVIVYSTLAGFFVGALIA
jgi:uncharacterized protein